MNSYNHSKLYLILKSHLFVFLTTLLPSGFLMGCNYINVKALRNNMFSLTEINIEQNTKHYESQFPKRLHNKSSKSEVCIIMPLEELPNPDVNALKGLLKEAQKINKKPYYTKTLDTCGNVIDCNHKLCQPVYKPAWLNLFQYTNSKNESKYKHVSKKYNDREELVENSLEPESNPETGVNLEVGIFSPKEDEEVINEKLIPLRKGIKEYLGTCSSNKCKCKNSSTCFKIMI